MRTTRAASKVFKTCLCVVGLLALLLTQTAATAQKGAGGSADECSQTQASQTQEGVSLILQDPSGQPITDATVIVSPVEFSRVLRSDSSGVVTMESVDAGTYWVTTPGNGAPNAQMLDVRGGGTGMTPMAFPSFIIGSGVAKAEKLTVEKKGLSDSETTRKWLNESAHDGKELRFIIQIGSRPYPSSFLPRLVAWPVGADTQSSTLRAMLTTRRAFRTRSIDTPIRNSWGYTGAPGRLSWCSYELRFSTERTGPAFAHHGI